MLLFLVHGLDLPYVLNYDMQSDTILTDSCKVVQEIRYLTDVLELVKKEINVYRECRIAACKLISRPDVHFPDIINKVNKNASDRGHLQIPSVEMYLVHRLTVDITAFNDMTYISLCLFHNRLSAHRAYVDCLALIWIMHIEPEAFSMLVEHALKKTCRVLAVGSPFDVKDKLKAQGYRYDGQRKTWYIDVPSEEEAQRQIAWLQGIYNASQVVIEIFTAKNRFKTR